MSNFNQQEYNNQYNKEHYTRPSILFKKDEFVNIKNYCKDFGISVSRFVQLCCKYCIDNVHIDELKRYK